MFLKALLAVNKGKNLGDVMKKGKDEYVKWKEYHLIKGGGIMDSINQFILDYIVKPYGKAVVANYKKRQ